MRFVRDERPRAGRGKPWGALAVVLGLSVISLLLAALAVVVRGAVAP